jgi:hypothetical protein
VVAKFTVPRVLESAFEDLDVVVVDYPLAHGRGSSSNPRGSATLFREFDAGRYPGRAAAVSRR